MFLFYFLFFIFYFLFFIVYVLYFYILYFPFLFYNFISFIFSFFLFYTDVEFLSLYYKGVCENGRVLMKTPVLEVEESLKILKPLLNRCTSSLTIRNDLQDMGIYFMSRWVLNFLMASSYLHIAICHFLLFSNLFVTEINFLYSIYLSVRHSLYQLFTFVVQFFNHKSKYVLP